MLALRSAAALLIALCTLTAAAQSPGLSNAFKLADIVNVRDPQWAGGAKCDGTTNDSAAFQAAIDSGKHVYVYGSSNTTICRISTPLTAVTGMQLICPGRATLKASTNGKHIIGGSGLANVKIDGCKFEGTGSSTSPTDSIGGQASSSTGLVTFFNTTDVRIENAEAYNFYNGLSCIRCTRLWIAHNRIRNFKVYGVLASESSQSKIERNDIRDSDQTGGAESYGVMITGDSSGGNAATANSISFNTIANIPSWDGVMSHDSTGLRVIGNDIRNVRIGVDIGKSVTGNTITDITVANNYIKSTTTDTWSGSGAQHSGISVQGLSGSQLTNVVISGNTVADFYGVSGLTTSGDASNIVVAWANQVAITGNVVVNAGSQQSNAGIYLVGDMNNVSVSGNSLQGTMAAGGIRLASVSGTGFSIAGNTIRQANTSNIGIWASGSTITALALGPNSSNSVAGSEFLFANTVTFKGADMFYTGSATYDPPSLASGATQQTTVTVTGAVVGDYAEVTFGNANVDIVWKAEVTSANTVTVTQWNRGSGAVDLASGTLRARVRPRDL
jgi:hypothetical protein